MDPCSVVSPVMGQFADRLFPGQIVEISDGLNA
jgi:hypothetical protein